MKIYPANRGSALKWALTLITLSLGFSLFAGNVVSPQAMKIHKDAIVCDLHADTQFMVTYMGYDMAKEHHAFSWGLAGAAPMFSDIDIPRLKKGGVELFNMSVCPVPKDNRTPGAAAFVRRSLNAIDRMLAKNQDSLAIAHSPEEARSIIASGRIAVLLGLEGGQGIEENPDTLHEFYNRGVRYMTITHSKHLSWASSGGDKHRPKVAGLNEFGKQVVREMEKMGMIIDLSHVSEQTFWDAYNSVKCPVVVTHSAARGLADHHRNLTDAQILAVAKRGGVVGVIFYDKYLDPTGKKPKDISLVVDHIDYIKKLAGVDVIALGSDFDGDVTVPKELSDVSKMPAITEELLKRGYSEQEIKKILGENFLRAWSLIEKAAAK